MERTGKSHSVRKIIAQCILVLLGAVGMIVMLNILPVWLILNRDAEKHERQLQEVRELAETYLAEQFPGNDFEITNLYHHWYDDVFYVKVQSASSADTHFTVTYDDEPLEFLYDTYARDVPEGGNVRRRVTEEYSAAVQKLLNGRFPELDMEADFSGAQGQPQTGEKPEAELDVSWELDKQYDISALGAQAGVVTVRFDNTKGQWPQECRMEVLCRIAQAMKEADMGFFAVDVLLAEERYYGNPVYHLEQRILASELD